MKQQLKKIVILYNFGHFCTSELTLQVSRHYLLVLQTNRVLCVLLLLVLLGVKENLIL